MARCFSADEGNGSAQRDVGNKCKRNEATRVTSARGTTTLVESAPGAQARRPPSSGPRDSDRTPPISQATIESVTIGRYSVDSRVLYLSLKYTLKPITEPY